MLFPLRFTSGIPFELSVALVVMEVPSEVPQLCHHPLCVCLRVNFRGRHMRNPKREWQGCGPLHLLPPAQAQQKVEVHLALRYVKIYF